MNILYVITEVINLNILLNYNKLCVVGGDTAKYEICAHKYVDLSENNYGVALLNDCKYGYRAKGNVLDLNLLRRTLKITTKM